MSDYTSEELAAIAKAVSLVEQLADALHVAEAWPDRIKIETETRPGVLGWIGMNGDGAWVFEPYSGEGGFDGE